ncbi:MAG: ImmA/IrrE family metallo-endopeptidase [Peptoniphilus sp. oral taxon 375]|nr:ImmA/IrrE family metallo-endopeptidase [Peptoniphilus sp. oral taxon 375]
MDIETIKKAQSVCRKYGTTDPFRICKEKDIVVIDKEMPRQLKGLTITKKRISFIYINSLLFLHNEEREFVCGHELGHIFLKHDQNVIFTRTNTLLVQGKEENEADLFSATLFLEKYDKEVLKRTNIGQIEAITGINSLLIKTYMESLKT